MDPTKPGPSKRRLSANVEDEAKRSRPEEEEPGEGAAVAAQPVVAQPVEALPVAAQPVAAQLIAAQPVEAQPVAALPVEALPVAAQPVAAQPVAAQPIAAQPVTAQPVPAQPVAAQPVTAQPVPAQPVAAQPVAAQPVAAQLVEAQPVAAQLVEALPVAAQPVGLLDLSDDVLLCVLQYCSPRDLKALGFTSARLGRLVCDRSLWCRVDARACGTGREQLAWYLRHGLGPHTTLLALRGFASELNGCMGTVECSRPTGSKENPPSGQPEPGQPELGADAAPTRPIGQTRIRLPFQPLPGPELIYFSAPLANLANDAPVRLADRPSENRPSSPAIQTHRRREPTNEVMDLGQAADAIQPIREPSEAPAPTLNGISPDANESMDLDTAPADAPAHRERRHSEASSDDSMDLDRDSTDSLAGPSRLRGDALVRANPNLSEMLFSDDPPVPPNYELKGGSASAGVPGAQVLRLAGSYRPLNNPRPDGRASSPQREPAGPSSARASANGPVPSSRQFIAGNNAPEPPAQYLNWYRPDGRSAANRDLVDAAARRLLDAERDDPRNDAAPPPAQRYVNPSPNLRRMLVESPEPVLEPAQGPRWAPVFGPSPPSPRRPSGQGPEGRGRQQDAAAPLVGEGPAAERGVPCRRPCFHFRQRYHCRQLPRFSGGPAWRVEEGDEGGASGGAVGGAPAAEGACAGPRWTLTRSSLDTLRESCVNLAVLHLEDCNIDCKMTQLSDYPRSLKMLSLRGTRCYNMELNKSYLFRVQEYLPNLEELDVSECRWMEPATLMPLSKLTALRVLRAERCPRLTECVAYASLAARYGFRKLKVLDLRGTPLGDSEVSGFGWTPELEELLLEPAETEPPAADGGKEQHSHYHDDVYVRRRELDPWEEEEPEYFRTEAEKSDDEDICPQCDTQEELDTLVNGVDGQAAPDPSCLNRFSEMEREREERPSRAESSGGGGRNDADPGELPAKKAKRSEERSQAASCEPSTSQLNETGDNGASRPESSDSSNPNPSNVNGGRSTPLPASDDRPTEPQCPRAEPRAEDLRARRARLEATLRRQQARIAEREARDRRAGGDGDGLERIVEMDDRLAPGRVHVIYVNVRRPRNDAYRMIVQDERPRDARGLVELPPEEGDAAQRNVADFVIGPDLNRFGAHERQVMNIFRMPYIQNFLYGPAAGAGHLAGDSLITDAAINRFGHSDGPDAVNYVHIGPNGAFRAGAPPPHCSERPNKSKLRVLVCRGFRGITNRSLNHLVTAAPALRLLDVSGTAVTEQDVAAFRNLRPDCEVKFTPAKECDN